MQTNLEELIQFFGTQKEFQSAVEYTAGRYGFSTNLIEKDYLCSLVLMYLYENETPLVFKGGTLLAKSYADFYRLSEDLDFSIPISLNATRRQRSQKISLIKDSLCKIQQRIPIFTITKSLTGSNESRQYNMEISYQSVLSSSSGKILIEIGLRNELSQPSIKIEAKTLLTDAFLGEKKVNPFPIYGLTLKEAYAEKIRAALTRKKLAIRDFFDLHYAIENRIINIHDMELKNLVEKKLENETISSSLFNHDEILKLHEKIDSELMPTLSVNAVNDFKLEKIIESLLASFKKIVAIA